LHHSSTDESGLSSTATKTHATGNSWQSKKKLLIATNFNQKLECPLSGPPADAGGSKQEWSAQPQRGDTLLFLFSGELRSILAPGK